MDPIKLTKQQLADLRTAQRTLHDILPEIDKAGQCGVDCQAILEVHQQAADRINLMLKHYGK